jgi:hypothetical protein
VTDVGRRLDALGRALEFPPTPELAPGVLARMRTRRARRRRALVAALAALALVAAVLAASPGARSAIAGWLGIGGVRIVRVDELPVVPRRAEPALGERVSLAEARRRVPFAVTWPRSQGEPDEVYVRDFPEGGTVTLVYGSVRRPRLVLSEWRGLTYEPVLLKTVGIGTRVDPVRVDVSRGVWVTGAPHLVVAADRDFEEWTEALWLAGNVLVWERGGRAFRLEADIAKEDALRLASDTR